MAQTVLCVEILLNITIIDWVLSIILSLSIISSSFYANSVIAGQTMVWAIFHLLLINFKFQWAILAKFNIAISFVNGPFFC